VLVQVCWGAVLSETAASGARNVVRTVVLLRSLWQSVRINNRYGRPPPPPSRPASPP
jgi:hypothetical protein